MVCGMTTAREQAREAVASTYNAAPIGTNVGLTSLADAASDVWEPLVYRMAEAIRLTREYVGEAELPNEAGWSWHEAMKEAERALGVPLIDD
jgi:hypothetical protein